ncbi:MAG: LytTR family DNA-binding domain-containing protein [Ekhidna sp.]|uniref:LytR/AlgR family response regulator transcription factor n=1 Tax=Ekhidna sp. TaxID=2608089 RepID=UPI0032ED0E30
MNRIISIGLISFIVLLIFFDAAQQKYYLDTFDLYPNGVNISLTALIKNHFIRWSIWGLISIPFGLLVWRKLPKDHSQPSIQCILVIAGWILSCALVAISLISLQSILAQNTSWTFDLFGSSFIFFTFQKGLTFLMTFLALSLILYNRSREKTIESQVVEIKNLIRKSTDLEKALDESNKEEPHLNIKTGYKVQPIPISDIIWIQSDDYCVKIHTHSQAFTLRKSMKALEEQLTPYGFIRIHRVALLNLSFLHQINFDSSKIKLTNTEELPLSKAGARVLKQKLEKAAL